MADTVQEQPKWYSMTPEAVAQQLKVDPAKGLSAAEAQQRLQQYGKNVLAAKKKESGWQAFLRQYKDFMQILLVGVALISLVVTREAGTTLVLLGLTVFNAILGLHGESKAEASLAALEKMMKNITRVRRDGLAIEIEAEGLVPGDIGTDGGGQPRTGRWAPVCHCDPRNRGSCPDWRERCLAQGHRGNHQARCSSRRPPVHGLHEHRSDPRSR